MTNIEPTQLGVSTKGGKIIVTSTGDSLIIEKEKVSASKEPIQIVRIEAEDPPRDVKINIIPGFTKLITILLFAEETPRGL